MIWPITLVQMRLLTRLKDVDFRVRFRARPFSHLLRCECLLLIEELFMFAVPTSCTRVTPPSMPGPASSRVLRGSVLQLHSSAIWVTPCGVMPRRAWPETDSASTDSGDVFLQAGQCLPVSAGQYLVLQGADTPQQGLVNGMLVRAVRQH